MTPGSSSQFSRSLIVHQNGRGPESDENVAPDDDSTRIGRIDIQQNGNFPVTRFRLFVRQLNSPTQTTDTREGFGFSGSVDLDKRHDTTYTTRVQDNLQQQKRHTLALLHSEL